MTSNGIHQKNHFRSDLLTGLQQSQKRISSKYFYDQIGSKLFDQITDLKEYYPTRTELGILRRDAHSIASVLGPNVLLIEPGAGSLVKVKLLLDRLEQPAAYVPVEISAEHLNESARHLQTRYPTLPIMPICADFTQDFVIPEAKNASPRRVIFFPGSTLGNLNPSETRHLLSRFAQIVGSNGGILLGIDLQKDPAVIEAAYNDSLGVTAAFNQNVLARANRELNANFDLNLFRHRAFYNRRCGRIEMHLESTREHQVVIDGIPVQFMAGETIHTENSYKYNLDEFAVVAEEAGLKLEHTWTDDQQYFGVLYLRAN